MDYIKDEDLKSKVDEVIQEVEQNILEMNKNAVEKNANELLHIAENYNHDWIKGNALHYLGVYESMENHFLNALDYYFKSVDTITNTSDMKLLSRVYTNIGRAYGCLDEQEKLLKFSLKAVEIDNLNTSAVVNSAIAFSKTGQDSKALEYFEQSLILCRQIKEEKNIPIILLGIGVIYLKKGEVNKALISLNKALQYSESQGMNFVVTRVLYNIGIVYNKMGNSFSAEEKLLEAISRSEEVDDSETKALCYDALSNIYLNEKKYLDVIEYQKKYIEIKENLSSSAIKRKISIMQDMFTHERKKRDLIEKKLENSNKEIQERLLKLSHAYAEVSGIGRVGIFSTKMNNIVKLADFFHSDRSVPVLIEGETGTGKEIIARMVHFGKENTTSPFIILNCSAISSSLFESELFGYEEGAFTGARKMGMMGKLELAQGGTLFLDEIGELPLELQPKLLRVLQQKEFYRVGGKNPIKLDVRIICATNRDLKDEINESRFRSDLYYRLNTGRLFIPPLRDRKEEIVPLAEMFLVKFAEEKKRKFKYISKRTTELLEGYSWPGNIRELENAIERVVLIYDDIEAEPWHFSFISDNGSDNDVIKNKNYFTIELPDDGRSYDSIDKEVFSNVLAKFGNNQMEAARYLEVSRHTIYRKKKKYNL